MLARYKVFINRIPFRPVITLVLVSFLFVLFSGPETQAERATIEEARQVSQNWLNYMVFQKVQWAKEKKPEVMGSLEIIANDTVLGYYFPISPSGYIAVPILKELPPVKAYSDQYRVDFSQTQGFPALLEEVLQDRIRLYIKLYGSLDAVQPLSGDVLLDRKNKLEWTKFLKTGEQFKKDLSEGKLSTLAEKGPLLTTSWYQGSPYNNFCPMGDGGHCVVGCVATAAAQIMKYWNWPPSGTGSHSYTWNGDSSCGGSTPPQTLSANFSDSYDWVLMPNNCHSGCDQAQQDALAELCFEVGVAFNMNYGFCSSGAYTSDAVTVYPTYFRYDPTIDKEDRNQHTLDEWFSIIVTEINNGRPMQYRISGHSIVCDGWRYTGQYEYHMNYGWDDEFTTWYALDGLYCPWPGCGPMVEYLIRYIRPSVYGACCIPSIGCVDGLAPQECLAQCGRYMGGGTTCYKDGVECPTLTQWGVIILVALLVGSAIFIMLRRRKAIVPN
jgi:hypothetical protein